MQVNANGIYYMKLKLMQEYIYMCVCVCVWKKERMEHFGMRSRVEWR